VAASGKDAQARVDAEAARWGWSSSVDRAAAGSVDAVAAQVARWAAAGADAVILQPTADEPDPEAFVAFAAAVGRAVDRG
jgi:alkanesulfonate monooxygenase SsuD/methylene tetrahydromethanopterin reductase-like flavin-dependent oxidoreductase (luciferase family)